MTQDSPVEGPVAPGLLGKPLVEKLKLLVLFALIGALVFFSKPTIELFATGLVFVVVGTAVRVWAAGHLTRDQKLTTSGPYAYTRNPFYLGRLLLIIGFGFMTGLADWKLIALLAVTLLVFFAYYMPRKEQREGGRLASLFGEDYEKWKANVPSLFPRITPFVMNPRPWSYQLFMSGDDMFSGNKEAWTTLATILLVVLFLLRMIIKSGALTQ